MMLTHGRLKTVAGDGLGPISKAASFGRCSDGRNYRLNLVVDIVAQYLSQISGRS